jgi:hypothetical protein
MPWLLAFVAGLAPIVLPWVFRILAAVGVGSVTYLGIGSLFDVAESYILANFAAVPPSVLSVLGIMQVDRALTLLLSALSARLTLAGLSAAGSLTRGTWRPPGSPFEA